MKRAFTLAEVLITLGIIGVVAALTLPILVYNYQEKQYISKLKKAIATLDNAYKLAIAENGGNVNFGYITTPDWAVLPDSNGKEYYDKNTVKNSTILYNALKPHLNILKECENLEPGCFPDIVYSPFDNTTWNLIKTQGGKRKFFVLKDGTSIGVTPNFAYIDVNGLKKPNKAGVDIFQIAFNENGVGYYDDGSDGTPWCYSNPFTCASWVILNENIDYIHCNNLNWHNKTKCK